MKTNKALIGITGALLIVLGVLCFFYPGDTLFATAWLIGIMVLFTGISKFIFSLRTQAFLPNSGTRMLSAVLEIMLGCFFLFHNLFVAASLPIVFAMWIVIEGISMAVESFDLKRVGVSSWWCMLIGGLCGVVLGIVGLYHVESAAMAITWLVGSATIMLGVGHFVLLSSINKLEKFFAPIRQRMQQMRDTIDAEAEEIKKEDK